MIRDSIDWEKTPIGRLFGKIFLPTLLGMLLASTINIADGIFVGRGAGSDALAAVNIVAPLFMLTTGIGLMFGSGASIVASVHISRGNEKAARINITQAFIFSFIVITAISLVMMIWTEETARLLGSSDRLMPYVLTYMRWIVPSMPFGMLLSIGLFIIRLDGSPRFAMACNMIPAIVNIVLDFVFVFPMGMGIEGASLATALAEVFGSFLIMVYMFKRSRVLHFYPLKLTQKSFYLTMRNVWYQVKLGASSMIGEAAIACMMFTGNIAFLNYLGEDGVAAFSVACYTFPLMFMVGNAIAQSAQPIISYNHGARLYSRVQATLRLSLSVAALSGVLAAVVGMLFSVPVVSLFLPAGNSANEIATSGIPMFSFAFALFPINLVCIGYYQSIERFRKAMLFMLLRGVVFLVPCFCLLPYFSGIAGLWLAVPVSEAVTLIVILTIKSL
ncbi:MAG: MATE family efflux transporter [Muribaculaceae bacterium]